MITNRVTGNQQQLELSLKDWQEYTSLSENLMVWLREKEKILRAQSKALTVRDVERELGTMKVPYFLVLYFRLNVDAYFDMRFQFAPVKKKTSLILTEPISESEFRTSTSNCIKQRTDMNFRDQSN